jgi:hypothetical protein
MICRRNYTISSEYISNMRQLIISEPLGFYNFFTPHSGYGHPTSLRMNLGAPRISREFVIHKIKMMGGFGAASTHAAVILIFSALSAS